MSRFLDVTQRFPRSFGGTLSKKTAARETSKAGVFCKALNRQRVGASQQIIPRERLTSQSRGGGLKKANKENQLILFPPRFSLYTGGRTGSF